MKICKECGGSGYKTCPCCCGDGICDGEKCPICHGSGTVICRYCGGFGEIENFSPNSEP